MLKVRFPFAMIDVAMTEQADSNAPIRTLLAIGGIVGLLFVAALQFLAAIGPVKGFSFGDHLLFAAQGLPFAYYIFRTKRGWKGGSTLIPDVLVHLVWLPAFFYIGSGGNFEIPLITLGIFAVYMVISRNAQRAAASSQ